MAENNASINDIPWDCSCGGTDDLDSVVCTSCNTRHHVACAFTLLRGSDDTAKWAVLRPTSFACMRCAPSLYSWHFRCSCMRAGSVEDGDRSNPAVVIDFDDMEDQEQCEDCWCWAHKECNFIELTNIWDPVNVAASTVSSTRDERKEAATSKTKMLCSICRAPGLYESPGRFRYLGGGKEMQSLKTKSYGPLPLVLLTSDPRFVRITGAEGGLQTKLTEGEEFLDGGKLQLMKNLERIRALYWRRGMRDDKIYEEVVLRGVYERPIFDFEILPGDIWLDLGAHIGVFSSLALVIGAAVIAVEPDPDNADLLERNVTLNASDDGVQPILYRAAIVDSLGISSSQSLVLSGNETSQTILYRHPEIAFRHSTVNKRRQKAWSELKVRAMTLPELLVKHPEITAIKIDLQGSEVSAIRSVIKSRNWGNVRKLVFEYDFEYSPLMEDFHAFILLLREDFPYIYHSHLAASGKFRGFPNGVVVFAKKDPPRSMEIFDRFASGRVGTMTQRSSKPTAKREKTRATTVATDTAYWDRFKKSSLSSSSSASSSSSSLCTINITNGRSRPKRQCVGRGVEVDHTKALDAAGYVKAFRFAKGSSIHRQTKFTATTELSDIEDEMDMEDIVPEGELDRGCLTGLPLKRLRGERINKRKRKGR